MQNLKIILFGFLISFTLSGCFNFDDDGGLFNCDRGEGDVITKKLNMPEFEGIKLDISADVFITQGDEQLVEVKGQENIIDLLQLDVQNDTWDIEFDGCVRNHEKLEIFITIPTIKELRISGSGSINSTNFITGEEMELKVSGSGDMDLGLEVEKIDARISGSGKMKLEGKTELLDIEVSGSGDVHSFELTSEECNVIIKGSGDVEVFVTDKLDIRISGSGDVFYKGNPLIDVDITGSGDVINAN